MLNRSMEHVQKKKKKKKKYIYIYIYILYIYIYIYNIYIYILYIYIYIYKNRKKWKKKSYQMILYFPNRGRRAKRLELLLKCVKVDLIDISTFVNYSMPKQSFPRRVEVLFYHKWSNKEYSTFYKGISPKVNINGMIGA